MSRYKHGLFLAFLVGCSSTLFLPIPAEAKAPEGKWVEDERGYWYDFSNGSWAKNEYINGYWIRKNGYWDQGYKYSWHYTENGGYWWGTVDGSWYAKDCWQKIDSNWYYFNERGYMASNEYIHGYWVDRNGAYNRGYAHGRWHISRSNDSKWWFSDTIGSSGTMWIPKDQWLKIDGHSYYFDKDGWMLEGTVEKLPKPNGNSGVSDEMDYYAFDSNGHLTQYTRYCLADYMDADIHFRFNTKDETEMSELIEGMELFFITVLDKDSSKTLKINGSERMLSLAEDDSEGVVVLVDGIPLGAFVDNYSQNEVVIGGTANMKKVIEAYDISGIRNKGESSYSFWVEINDLRIRFFAYGELPHVYFSMIVRNEDVIEANTYSGILDFDNDQITLCIGGDLTEKLTRNLKDKALIRDIDGADAVIVDSATREEMSISVE